MSDSEVKFECGTCGQHIVVSAEHAGVIVPCPSCGHDVIIPRLAYVRAVASRPLPQTAVPPQLPAPAASDAAGRTFSAPPRGVGIRDIVVFVAAFIAVWNFAPESIVIPVSCLSGLALAYFGVAMFFPLRRWLYLHGRDAALRVELLSGGTSLVLAFLSLILWEPLFTFRHYWFWHEMNSGQVSLWFMLTWLFGHLFFVSRKVFAIATKGPNQALQSTPDRPDALPTLPSTSSLQQGAPSSGVAELDSR